MELVSSVQSYRDKFATGLAKRYLPNLLPGETAPDYGLAIELAVRDVRVAVDRLSELDDQVAYARTDQVSRSKERLKLVREELYPRTVAVRGEIDLALGRDQGMGLHGMRGRTRRSPPALQRQLKYALARLADPERKTPALKHRQAFVDRDRWLQQLQPLYLELETLSRAIERGRAEVPALTSEKNAAMAAYDLSYRDALALVKAAFTAAGLTGTLITNLKPYYQRRRMAAQARRKRQARAAASAVTEPAAKTAAPATQDKDRVAVPVSIAEWLEDNRRLVNA